MDELNGGHMRLIRGGSEAITNYFEMVGEIMDYARSLRKKYPNLPEDTATEFEKDREQYAN